MIGTPYAKYHNLYCHRVFLSTSFICCGSAGVYLSEVAHFESRENSFCDQSLVVAPCVDSLASCVMIKHCVLLKGRPWLSQHLPITHHVCIFTARRTCVWQTNCQVGWHMLIQTRIPTSYSIIIQ